MKRNYLPAAAVMTMIIFVFLSGAALATDVRNTPTTYGVKLGLISPGTWFVGDFEYDPDMGYSIGGFLDYKLGPKISGGIDLDLNGFNAYETSSNLINFGITLKAILYSETSNLTFRPGIGIGYGTIGKMDIYESSSYFMLKGGVEMVYSAPGGLSWLGELALIGSPDGGNDDIEMYLGTGFLLRAGLVFQ